MVLKTIAAGSHAVKKEVGGASQLDEHQWVLSQSQNIALNRSTLIKAEYRRSPRQEVLQSVYFTYTVSNSGGADIDILPLWNMLDRFRIKINGYEVKDWCSVIESRAAWRHRMLVHFQDDKKRDNHYHSETNVNTFLDGVTGLFNPITVPAGGSVEIFSQLSDMTATLDQLPLDSVGLIEIECTVSNDSNFIGSLASANTDLTLNNVEVWSRHKRSLFKIPRSFSSWTVTHVSFEYLRLAPSQHPFQLANQSLDLQLHVQVPVRSNIVKYECYLWEPTSADSYRAMNEGKPRWITELDLIKSGCSKLEHHYDRPQRIQKEVQRYYERRHGLHTPTHLGDAGHNQSWNFCFIDPTAVSGYQENEHGHGPQAVVAEGDSNRDQTVFRVRNGAVTASATEELHVVVTYLEFYRLNSSGAVVKINA